MNSYYDSIALKTGKILKLVAVNIVIFAILLMTVNWLCGAYLKRSGTTNRAALPNYASDQEHAEAVFADYSRVQHRYEPFVGWKTLPYKGKTTNISSQGLRTHGIGSGDVADQEVVRFFGGSTMWGEGSDDQHTIPALFHQRNPQFQVYNHGQLAYNSRQELDELISMYARNERADLVIFYDGVNDAAFLCPAEIAELPAHRLVPMYREKLYTRKLTVVKELAYKLFVEEIMNVIRKATYRPTPENSPYDCLRNPGKAEAIAEMMMKNWEMAEEIVTKRNGTFLAVLQPAAFIGNPRTDHLELDEELGKNFSSVYEHLKAKIAERKHPWVLDLSDAFDNDDYIFIDFCHVSPNGNEIIAQRISSAIKDSARTITGTMPGSASLGAVHN